MWDACQIIYICVRMYDKDLLRVYSGPTNAHISAYLGASRVSYLASDKRQSIAWVLPSGFIKACPASIQALFRPYSGSIQALLRSCVGYSRY